MLPMTALAVAAILASSVSISGVIFLVHRKIWRRHGERWFQPYKASR